MSAKGFEAVAKYEYFCEEKNKLIESVGCWALEEMLHLRAEAFFMKKQKMGLRNILLEWSEVARTTTTGTTATTATTATDRKTEECEDEQEEEEEAPSSAHGNFNSSGRVVSHAISLEEGLEALSLGFVKDGLLRQTLEALDLWNAGSEALVEVVEQIEDQERDNQEILSTLRFGFQLQRVDEEKISSINKNPKTRMTIKLSRVIQNIKVLRLKAELLAMDTGAIDRTLRHLEQQLAGGTSTPNPNLAAKTGEEHEEEGEEDYQGLLSRHRASASPTTSPTTATRHQQVPAAARSYTTTGDSSKTVYESAEDNGYDDYDYDDEYDLYRGAHHASYSDEENSYNSHLRSPNNVFGYHVKQEVSNMDTTMFFDEDDEDSIFGSPAQPTPAHPQPPASDREGEGGDSGSSSPFGVNRAKQLLHNLQSIKNVGKKLYY